MLWERLYPEIYQHILCVKFLIQVNSDNLKKNLAANIFSSLVFVPVPYNSTIFTVLKESIKCNNHIYGFKLKGNRKQEPNTITCVASSGSIHTAISSTGTNVSSLSARASTCKMKSHMQGKKMQRIYLHDTAFPRLLSVQMFSIALEEITNRVQS